jgi:glycosyltransferase involved in cell wall biosynthesis
MKTNTVSIIIPTFNRLKVLKQTIASVFAQNYPLDQYEVIIIDDSSTDGTREFLTKIQTDRNFQYILNDTNLGRAKTRNRGILAANGEFILMIDDDILTSQNLLKHHLEEHKKCNKDVAVVGSILVDDNVPDTAINDFLNRHHIWCYDQMCQSGKCLPYNFCKTANLSLRKTILLEIGMFNEAFIKYGGEDTELGDRLESHNIKLIFAQAAVGYHYHAESVKSFAKKEKERGISLKLYSSIRSVTPKSRGKILSPYYYKTTSLRYLLLNILKSTILNNVSTYFNFVLISFFNKSKNKIIQKLMLNYALPILKVQFQAMGMKCKSC